MTVTGKYDRTRLVPLHPTTAAMLRDYRQRCGQLFPGPATPSFFLSAAGTRPFRSAVEATFSRLLVRAAITPRHRRPPRIHDLRHYADAWVMCPAVKFPLVEVVEPVLRSA
jgi:integrase